MMPMKVVEGQHLRRVLETTDSDMVQSARILGISRSTLYGPGVQDS
jgi:transcriptional regulator of acetoin/glycerol metabolism